MRETDRQGMTNGDGWKDMRPEFVLPVLLRLAAEASEVILTHYRTTGEVARKQDGSPVTPADKAANHLILTGLRQVWPDIPVLAEESEDPMERRDARWLFVVDPLDGTKEYLKRNDEFSVNIALLEENRPVIGVIRMPVSGEAFWAAKGHGTWRSRNDEPFHQVRVSARSEDLVLALSRSHPSTQTEALLSHPRVASTRVSGSSYKGCLLACGEADAYYRFGRTMEWDTAAMQVIVEEAGGFVRQMDGSPMRYNKPVPENANGFFLLNRMENHLL